MLIIIKMFIIHPDLSQSELKPDMKNGYAFSQQ